MSRRVRKKYDQMTAAELREATEQYEKELPPGGDGLPGRALNARERKQWKKVRRKMGRPKIGKGAKRVMVSLEAQLLKESDAFAKRHQLSRSQMISEGLRKLMAG
jgi:hypothetical protein